MCLLLNVCMSLFLSVSYAKSYDVKKENGKLQIKKTASGYEVEAQFDTKISAFSIPIPKYAGLALKDAIQVHVKTMAVESTQ